MKRLTQADFLKRSVDLVISVCLWGGKPSSNSTRVVLWMCKYWDTNHINMNLKRCLTNQSHKSFFTRTSFTQKGRQSASGKGRKLLGICRFSLWGDFGYTKSFQYRCLCQKTKWFPIIMFQLYEETFKLRNLQVIQ